MERIAEYNASVDAISCLTEEDHFHGNVEYLKEIRAKSQLPILRKDFMICEYQFYEAKVIGADAVLLITAILDDAQMNDFYQLARELELDVLVETHDEAEVERAMKINPMHRVVNALPKEYRVPFAMHVSGFKYREIAEKLNLPLGTVKSRIFFTRQKLQEELKDFR